MKQYIIVALLLIVSCSIFTDETVNENIENIKDYAIYSWIEPDSNEFDTINIQGCFINEIQISQDSLIIRYSLNKNRYGESVRPWSTDLQCTKKDSIEDTVKINYGNKRSTSVIPYSEIKIDSGNVRALLDTVNISNCSNIEIPKTKGYTLKAEDLPFNYQMGNVKDYNSGCNLINDSILSVSNKTSILTEAIDTNGCKFMKQHYDMCFDAYVTYSVPKDLDIYSNRILVWENNFIDTSYDYQWRIKATDAYGREKRFIVSSRFIIKK